MRIYKNPKINHTFTIKEIDVNTIEIDGLVIHKKELDDAIIASNYANSNYRIKDLEFPILQHILAYKNQNNKI